MKGSGFALGLDAGSITLSDDDTSFLYNGEFGTATNSITNWNFARGPPPSLPADYFDLSATGGVGVTVTGVGAITVGSFDITRELGVQVTPPGGSQVTGQLFTVSLDNISIQLGGSGASLTASSTPATGIQLAVLSVSSNQSYTVVQGNGLSFAATLGPVTMSASGVAFSYDMASTGSAITDWSFANVSGLSTVVAGTTLNGTSALVSIAGIVTGSAGFSVTASSPSLTLPGDSGPETASLLQLTLTNLQLSVGTATVGVQISGGSIEVAALTSSTQINAAWVGVVGTSLSATLTVPELSASVSGVSVSINVGPSGTSDALDWASAVPTLTAFASLTAGVESVSGSLSSLSIAGIISGSAGFAVTASSPTLTLSGDSGAETASLLQLTLTDLQLSVGTATVGVQISGGEIQVADVTSSTSNKSFLAVLATGLTATLTVPELTASVSGVQVSINVGPSGTSDALDWASAVPTLTAFASLTAGVESVVGQPELALDRGHHQRLDELRRQRELPDADPARRLGPGDGVASAAHPDQPAAVGRHRHRRRADLGRGDSGRRRDLLDEQQVVPGRARDRPHSDLDRARAERKRERRLGLDQRRAVRHKRRARLGERRPDPDRLCVA